MRSCESRGLETSHRAASIEALPVSFGGSPQEQCRAEERILSQEAPALGRGEPAKTKYAMAPEGIST
jgi:hypothetical protein